MDTTVVCGPLGSGKTTYLRRLIGRETGKAVFLVNDFGRLGIDGEILSVEGAEVIEMPSGCVCCTLRHDLLESVKTLLERYRPDHLYVEPSGVASASGVIEGLNAAGIIRMGVVTLVDAVDFLEMHESGMCGRFLVDQIEQADLILVNKTDLVDAEVAAATVRVAEFLNPAAIVQAAVWARVETPVPVSSHWPKADGFTGPDFETFSTHLPAGSSPAAVSDLFDQLAAARWGRVARAKAVLETSEGCTLFDLASGVVSRRPLQSARTTSRLVVIGRSINHDGLRSMLLERF